MGIAPLGEWELLWPRHLGFGRRLHPQRLLVRVFVEVFLHTDSSLF